MVEYDIKFHLPDVKVSDMIQQAKRKNSENNLKIDTEEEREGASS